MHYYCKIMRKELITGVLLTSLFILPLIKVNAQKEVFLRKIDFELVKLNPSPADNEFFLTLQFNKGTKYKFAVTNHLNGAIGEAIVEIYDNDAGPKVVGTNVFQTKYFDQFMFLCTKTTFYDVVVKFKDNKLGASEINMFLVQ
jgi:hypothetical protein